MAACDQQDKREIKRSEWKSFRFSTALQGAACRGAGVEPMYGKGRRTFVSLARAVPQASDPFHFVSSFRVSDCFFSSFKVECGNASCFVAHIVWIKESVIFSSNIYLSDA